MICAYGPYSASATGGNGWSRDFLAGILTVPATPFFTNIGGKNHVEDACTILACIATLLIVAVYVIYWKGPELRKRSPFAQRLHAARAERRVSVMPGIYGSRRGSLASRSGSLGGSRQGSMVGRPHGNRGQSYAAQRAAEANREIENEKRGAGNV
jgi:hypothetical protein